MQEEGEKEASCEKRLIEHVKSEYWKKKI